MVAEVIYSGIRKRLQTFAAQLISVETMHAMFIWSKGFMSYFITSTFHHVWLTINVICIELYITVVWAVKAWCCWKVNTVNGYHY